MKISYLTGRLTEASALFEQAGSHGLALLGRADLAFDRGDMRDDPRNAKTSTK